MAEYIERKTYRERLADLEGWCQDVRKPGLKQALEMFDEIPTADVASVVHARWIDDGRGIIICPECKRGYNLHAKYTHYCPNCGAKMDGGDNDEAD